MTKHILHDLYYHMEDGVPVLDNPDDDDIDLSQ